MLHFLSEVIECFFPLSQSKALGYRQYLVCVGSKINQVWITITSLEVWLWGSLLWGYFFVCNSGTQTATSTMHGTEQLLDNYVLLLLKAYGSSFFISSTCPPTSDTALTHLHPCFPSQGLTQCLFTEYEVTKFFLNECSNITQFFFYETFNSVRVKTVLVLYETPTDECVGAVPTRCINGTSCLSTKEQAFSVLSGQAGLTRNSKRERGGFIS